jgi:ribosome recycling factor
VTGEDTLIDETLFDAEEKMEKAVSVARDDLSSIRTGRANPGMFSRLTIDYYGSATPITQLSSISIPQLTEERRRELVKQAKSKGEDAKVTVRNIRRKAMEELSRIKKDGEAGEDEVGRAEKELDKSTSTYTTQIDDLVKHKEGELLEV